MGGGEIPGRYPQAVSLADSGSLGRAKYFSGLAMAADGNFSRIAEYGARIFFFKVPDPYQCSQYAGFLSMGLYPEGSSIVGAHVKQGLSRAGH